MSFGVKELQWRNPGGPSTQFLIYLPLSPRVGSCIQSSIVLSVSVSAHAPRASQTPTASLAMFSTGIDRFVFVGVC